MGGNGVFLIWLTKQLGGGEWTRRQPDALLQRFCIDSAALGELFVALRAQRDGHQYLQKAVSSE